MAETVCCMCGDVGFPDKLFHCSKCRHRFQHSYCSNYYSEFAELTEVCDWCLSEERKSTSSNSRVHKSSPSGEKIKHNHRGDGGSSAEKATGKSPSPRTATRRYKLLKDVLC